jgi:VWFA-related protein
VFSQEKSPETVSTTSASYGFVVDNSGSFRLLLESVIGFVKAVASENGTDDEVFLVRFSSSEKVTMEQDITSSKAEIVDAAEAMFVEGGQKAITDAVNFSAKHLIENGRKENGRSKVLILITDGDERSSVSKLDETIQLMKDAKIRVFAIAVAELKPQTKILERLSRETGGRLFVMKSQSELRASVKEVAATMRKP